LYTPPVTSWKSLVAEAGALTRKGSSLLRYER
jgi:hypothetical protein